MTTRAPADVCLVLEGTYPYVTGGVSTWTHDLIGAQSHLTFHLVAVLPPRMRLEPRYRLPPNVVDVSHVFLGQLPEGARASTGARAVIDRLEGPLGRLHFGGGLADLAEVLDIVAGAGRHAVRTALLDSRCAWDLLLRMYRNGHAHVSFLDYFWTWRTQLMAMYSVLLAEIPPARIYHSLCTGYAGLFAARAHLEMRRPALLTEHGIYTNERRIEITMADWLQEELLAGLTIDKSRRDLKTLWIETFRSYSRACYDACHTIVTLYEGNTALQIEDGARPARLRVIPNGIDVDRFAGIGRTTGSRPPTVALIGRVVPIKDVKTFLRAVALLRETVPDARALVLGPLDEDTAYVEECLALSAHLALTGSVTFAGRVALDEYLPQVDVVVLTSLSESQPLVILEAGACGIPSVATDVGSCRELILGRSTEEPPLGPAGVVTPVASPRDTADGIARLLHDTAFYDRCALAAARRVDAHYNKTTLDRTYRALYQDLLRAPDAERPVEGTSRWLELASPSAS